MGRVYTYTCPRCEYRARVTGGKAQGFHCETRTIWCRDCRALYDVAIRVRVAEAEPAAPPNSKLLPEPKNHLPPMLLFGQPPRTRWVQFKPKCPVSRHHKIELWTNPGRCPRCGTFLERDGIPYRVWD